ncbi:hypothetical protein BGZ68_009775 [Mortierella alpina]|nr:hypothetical protein BGZ68_009775 [Mortierella alpina]
MLAALFRPPAWDKMSSVQRASKGKPSQGTSTTGNHSTTPSSSSTSTSTAQHRHRSTGLTRTGTIADSVTESIKSLGTGLKLGQLAGGLGLAGGSGSTMAHSRRGTTDSFDHHQHSSSSSSSLQEQHRGPYLNSAGGSASRSRVWGWSGPDTNYDDEQGDRAMMVRDQQDVAMERMRRMPQVEKMAQRYQDSWREIHDHTARNSEKADDAEEILEKVLEICTRHINVSVQLAEEAKDLKDLDKSMDEMVSMSGLESKIQTMEENAEVLSLADWKKAQTIELDKYMEAKKNELWDKAEMLSTRSEQFQKEEAARKLHQYQNQFQTDMERFRRTQEERQQELLWRHRAETPETTTLVDPAGASHGIIPSSGLASRNGSKKKILRVPQETFPVALLASEDVHEEEQRREKEDLDQFLGPATESDSKDDDDDNGDGSDDDDDDDDDDVDDGTENETEVSEDGTEEEDEDEDEDTSDDDLDPIAKARKARAMAAAAAQQSGGAKIPGSGSTISAFSALGRHVSPSTLSLSKS